MESDAVMLSAEVGAGLCGHQRKGADGAAVRVGLQGSRCNTADCAAAAQAEVPAHRAHCGNSGMSPP